MSDEHERAAADLARALLDRRASTTGARPQAAAPAHERVGANAPDGSPAFDEAATRRHLELATTLLQALTLRGRGLGRDNLANLEAADLVSASERERRLVALARRVHLMLIEHPIAARALVGALAAEGRRFAATPEGAALRDGLVRSPTLGRAALLWSSLTMGLIDDRDPAALPSTYVDTLVELSARDDLEPLLATMGRGRPR